MDKITTYLRRACLLALILSASASPAEALPRAAVREASQALAYQMSQTATAHVGMCSTHGCVVRYVTGFVAFTPGRFQPYYATGRTVVTKLGLFACARLRVGETATSCVPTKSFWRSTPSIKLLNER